MAKKPQVDIRKLKDEVAEHLKKSKWEKAAEVLAELAAAEPNDMTHRLKLGDAYRKLDQPQMAIEAYRQAAKFFSDEGQLIKAIGAVKIILEIDPRNAEAQRQLGDMNKRRLGKVPLARIPPPTGQPAAAGRRTRAIELDDPELDPDLPPEQPQALPDDAILTPEPEDLVAALHDEEVIPSEEFGRQGGPIADLLSSSAEEEIELLSISADEELAGGRPTEPPSVAAEDADLD